MGYSPAPINISPLRGSPPQNPLAPGELNGATMRLCAFARVSLLVQSVVLAKAQRRKGRKGKIIAMVVLNSQRPFFVTAPGWYSTARKQAVAPAGNRFA